MIPFRPAPLSAAALLFLSACSSDEPKKPDAPSDASTPTPAAATAAPDAGPLPTADAGPAPTPDAGPPPDAGAPLTTTSAPEDAPRAKASAFDRVLAKPKEAGASLDELEKKIERATGAKVQSLKKSMRTWVLIEFAPTSPARGDDEQRKLIGKLESSGLFSKVEGDRMMKVK